MKIFVTSYDYQKIVIQLLCTILHVKYHSSNLTLTYL